MEGGRRGQADTPQESSRLAAPLPHDWFRSCAWRGAQVDVEVAQAAHVQVAPGTPVPGRNVAKPGADEQEGGVAVGKGPDHPGAPADLAHDALKGIVGAQATPVFGGEGKAAEGLLDVGLHEGGGSRQPRPDPD